MSGPPGESGSKGGMFSYFSKGQRDARRANRAARSTQKARARAPSIALGVQKETLGLKNFLARVRRAVQGKEIYLPGIGRQNLSRIRGSASDRLDRLMNKRARVLHLSRLKRMMDEVQKFKRRSKITGDMERQLNELLAKLYIQYINFGGKQRAAGHIIADLMEAATSLAEQGAMQGGITDPARIIQRYGKKPLTRDDCIRLVNILGEPERHGAQGALQRAGKMLGLDNRWTVSEVAGYYVDTNARGREFQVEPILESAKAALKTNLEKAMQKATPAALAKVWSEFNAKLKQKVLSGNYATVDDAIIAVLQDRKMRVYMANQLAGGDATKEKTLAKALEELAGDLRGTAAQADDAAEAATRRTSGTVVVKRLKEIIDARGGQQSLFGKHSVITELKAMYKHLLMVTRRVNSARAMAEYHAVNGMLEAGAKVTDALADGGRQSTRDVGLVMREFFRNINWRAAGGYVLRATPGVGTLVVAGEGVARTARTTRGYRWGRAIKPGAWRFGRWAVVQGLVLAGAYGVRGAYRRYRAGQRAEIDARLSERAKNHPEFAKVIAALKPADRKFLDENPAITGQLGMLIFRVNAVTKPTNEAELDKYFTQKVGYELNPNKVSAIIAEFRKIKSEVDKTLKLMNDEDDFRDAVADCNKRLKTARKALVQKYGRVFVEEVESALRTKRPKSLLELQTAVKLAIVARITDLEGNANPAAEIARRIEEFEHPSKAWIKRVGSKGQQLMERFAVGYKLDAKTRTFLFKNPDLFKMIWIGLGQGVLAASNVYGYIRAVQKGGYSYSARGIMRRRRKGQESGNIAEQLISLLPANQKTGYVYKQPVGEGSLVRAAEVWAIGKRKTHNSDLHYMMKQFNANQHVRTRLSRFGIGGKLVYGQSLPKFASWAAYGGYSTAHGADLKEPKHAELDPRRPVDPKRGYLEEPVYAEIGITDLDTIQFIKQRPSLLKWIKANKTKMRNPKAIIAYIKSQRMILDKFSQTTLYGKLEGLISTAFIPRKWWDVSGKVPLKDTAPLQYTRTFIPTKALDPFPAAIKAQSGKGKLTIKLDPKNMSRVGRVARRAIRRMLYEYGQIKDDKTKLQAFEIKYGKGVARVAAGYLKARAEFDEGVETSAMKRYFDAILLTGVKTYVNNSIEHKTATGSRKRALDAHLKAARKLYKANGITISDDLTKLIIDPVLALKKIIHLANLDDEQRAKWTPE